MYLQCPDKRINKIEFFLNVFTEFAEFSDKNICHYSKRIFKLSPIHASVIYQIPWIQSIPAPFRENSNVLANEILTHTINFC